MQSEGNTRTCSPDRSEFLTTRDRALADLEAEIPKLRVIVQRLEETFPPRPVYGPDGMLRPEYDDGEEPK